MAHWINDLLGGDAAVAELTPAQIAVRCFIVYFAGLIAVRLGKSRLLSRASPLDVILAFILGSLLSRGINGSASLSGTLIAVATLVAIHSVLTALACRCHWLGDAVKGKQYLLISQGQILHENLMRSHISERDLIEELRLNANIEDPSEIETAYKERSGEVGVVPRTMRPRVLEVAVREGVQIVKMELSGRD